MSHTQPVEVIKYGGCDVMIFSLAGYKIFEGRLDGTRSRGRPRSRQGDDISDWTNKNLAECKTLARDRGR